jgi:geranylgeranyl diphosphate synthase, type II
VAFQIRDDVLNLTANFADYGKEIAGDILEGKRTLMLLHLLEQTQERQKVIEILEQPREQKTSPQVTWILEQMKQYGCIQFAQNIAHKHAERGLDLLEQGLAGAVNQAAVQEILFTARSLATRSA